MNSRAACAQLFHGGDCVKWYNPNSAAEAIAAATDAHEELTIEAAIFSIQLNKIDLSQVDVSMDGIELEDREYIAAIKEKREPNGSLAQVLPCMRVLGKLEGIVDPQRKAHA